MRLLVFIPLLFLINCAQKPIQKTDVPVPPHPCFSAVAKGDLEFMHKNLELCKSTKTQSGTTVLMLAAAKGRNDVINYLIQNGMDVNEMDAAFGMALDYAVVTDKVKSADLLILSGAILESKKPDGITPLMMAVQVASPAMVQALTVTKQGINSKAQDGWTALYFAIRRKEASVLYWLLRQGACKNVVDSYKQTPMDFAKEVGWEQGMAMIEKAPACGTPKPTAKKSRT